MFAASVLFHGGGPCQQVSCQQHSKLLRSTNEADRAKAKAVELLMEMHPSLKVQRYCHDLSTNTTRSYPPVDILKFRRHLFSTGMPVSLGCCPIRAPELIPLSYHSCFSAIMCSTFVVFAVAVAVASQDTKPHVIPVQIRDSFRSKELPSSRNRKSLIPECDATPTQ